MCFCLIGGVTGCAVLDDTINEIKGNLVGNGYTIRTYDNYGSKVMTTTGDKINIQGNPVKTTSYSSDGSVVAINLFNRKVRMRGDKLPMLTLTKGNQMNGASMILHKSIRKKIGDIVGGNFYVLPSSIHEVMIIPEEGFEAGELSKLVSTCNSQLYTEANSKDILSDKVQWCSMDGEILRRAENE